MVTKEKIETTSISEDIEDFEELELNSDLLRGIYGTYIYNSNKI